MAYENLAALYDGLMADIDYEAWADYINELLERFHCPGKTIIDLGCGTGSISIPLAQRGWQVIGLDRSAEMLKQAQNKAAAAGVTIQWLKQDMTEPKLEEMPHGVIATFDAFNYILDPEDLQFMLQELAQQMADDGLLIFDINTPYKLRQVLGNQIYSHHSEQIEYIWENQLDMENDICQMRLTFFTRDEATGLYRKSEEFHEERIYDPQLLAMWLSLSGFEVLGMYEPLSIEPLTEVGQLHKVVFVARRV